ncbi:MAG: DNA-processing protein DprA [Fervidobacterium sp.]|nr:DNA-processing protein DprA [Fervidobacterium sp.]
MKSSELVAYCKLFKKNLSEIEEFLSYGKSISTSRSLPSEFKELVSKIEERLSKKDIYLITYWDEEYPEVLRNISDPPVFLFVKGKVDYLAYNLFAVVGTRKMSSYGKQVTEQFVKELTKYFVIVSGMAYGIDSVAHTTALNSAGRTIAVLGCGVDVVYPKSNELLYKEIIKKGCVVSEYLPWERPQKYTFVARNRIISGLSQGVLVTEAGIDSGALITAKFGLEQGKDIFAVPGDIYKPSSEGTNYLIQNGAFLVTNPYQILEYYGFKEHKKLVELSEEEKLIIDILSTEHTVEEILEKTSKDFSEIMVLLTILELKGLIYRTESGMYAKAI